MTASLFDVVVCGSLNLDLVSTVPHLPNPGETLPATGLLRLPGGKGLNQAVAAARQCARVAMLGATGDDAEVQNETADLIYHLLVMLRARNLPLSSIIATLNKRHG